MESKNLETRTVDFRSIVWAEMWQSKFNSEYLKEYILLKCGANVVLRRAYWLIALFGLLYVTTIPNVTIISLVVLLLLSLADALNKHLFPNREDIRGLEYCHTFYNSYAPDIMEVWIKMEAGIWSEQKSMDEFYHIKKTERHVNYIINDLLNKPSNKAKMQAHKLTDTYFQNTGIIEQS